jgi:predicted dehydrogenase
MRKYVLAGASNRGFHMYAKPLYTDYSDVGVLAGVFDINLGRAALVASSCGGVPVYTDFDKMLAEQMPCTVIVTTVDAFHSDYIIRAMDAGCDVITEKPMTTDEQKCRAILAAEKRSGRKLTVTMNYRYSLYATRVKELLLTGVIGKITGIHFEWILTKVMGFGAHGASYYRRWNSRMAKSGGLLVHKSTHHFDLINWWLNDSPSKVSAFGRLAEYGAGNAPFMGTNCRSCDYKHECKYYYALDEFETKFYADNEHYDGYLKDGCVYSDEIDIYDNMSLSVAYNGGALLTYSLCSAAAYEGWRVSINGEKGRLEAFMPETGYQSRQEVYNTIKIFDLNDNVSEHRVTKATGGHGGGDTLLLNMLFRGVTDDALGLAADSKMGADSVLIGVAANISIKEGRIVDIDTLLKE